MYGGMGKCGGRNGKVCVGERLGERSGKVCWGVGGDEERCEIVCGGEREVGEVWEEVCWGC